SGTASATSIRKGSLSFYSYDAGLYGAYKIRVPKAGKYNITVEYRADSVGDTAAKMYILPISAKDSIPTEIATREPDAMVNFKGELLDTKQPFAQYKISAWPAPQAGEYIVVWVGSVGSARMNPANLIFDGCGETKADALIGEISLSDTELVAGESATIIPELYNGYTGDAVTGTITYSSSDSNVLSVDGTTVTAKKPGTATVYAEAAGCGNKVELDVKVFAANMSGVRAQYPLVEGMYGNKDIVKPNNITYAISGHRIDWFDYTGTYGGTTPSWNSQTARFMLKIGQYAAYKINVPAKGFYNVTLEYLVSEGDNSKADMYLLPGNTKKEDIVTALESVDPVFGDVDFLYSNHQGVSAGDILTYETGFDAKTAGEYLVVWKSNRLGAVRLKISFSTDAKRAKKRTGSLVESPFPIPNL
ncbi:MAG: Ig-like domain-containing protein, partial [Oscillospiraceae bacterium]|nr:Ig-like domain-containing protein [Oscillospiraceae bacterium]